VSTERVDAFAHVDVPELDSGVKGRTGNIVNINSLFSKGAVRSELDICRGVPLDCINLLGVVLEIEDALIAGDTPDFRCRVV